MRCIIGAINTTWKALSLYQPQHSKYLMHELMLLLIFIVYCSSFTVASYQHNDVLLAKVLQVLAIEFVLLAIEFVPLANEFVLLVNEFVPLAIEFEFVALAFEFIALLGMKIRPQQDWQLE